MPELKAVSFSPLLLKFPTIDLTLLLSIFPITGYKVGILPVSDSIFCCNDDLFSVLIGEVEPKLEDIIYVFYVSNRSTLSFSSYCIKLIYDSLGVCYFLCTDWYFLF
mmetsp:Transcript_1578/g.166  ORF Transcript_1578/g.166 Transcript_1578/m.166 type:complete len:107 (-) Transcript_1578:536-856(-)